MSEISEDYQMRQTLRKIASGKAKTPKHQGSWALVWTVSGKVRETITSNAAYKLCAGLKKQKKQSGSYTYGSLEIVPHNPIG